MCKLVMKERCCIAYLLCFAIFCKPFISGVSSSTSNDSIYRGDKDKCMLIEFTDEFTRQNTQTIMKEDGGITPNLTFGLL